MAKPDIISQREAHRLRREMARLKRQLVGLNSDYPNGAYLGTLELHPEFKGIIRTARLLEHVIVGVYRDGNLRLVAMNIKQP